MTVESPAQRQQPILHSSRPTPSLAREGKAQSLHLHGQAPNPEPKSLDRNYIIDVDQRDAEEYILPHEVLLPKAKKDGGNGERTPSGEGPDELDGGGDCLQTPSTTASAHPFEEVRKEGERERPSPNKLAGSSPNANTLTN